MSSSLPSLLADKLDLSEEQAQELLGRLAEAIRDHADATGVYVSGLGTFRTADGTLSFEPAAELAREVNRSFEGLSPEAAAPLALAQDSEQGGSTHPSQANLLSPRRNDSSLDAAPDTLSLRPPDPPVPVPTEVWGPVGDAPQDPASDPSDARAQDASDGKADSAPADTRPSRPRRDHSAGPRITAAVLAVLLLFGAGWLILGQQGVVPSPPSVLISDTESPTASNPGGPSESGASAADTTEARDTTADETTPSEDTSQTDEAASDARSSDARWTLVVASRGTQADAEENAETYRSRFSDEDLSVDIRTDETNNTTRHRVVVGTFASRQDALEAMEEHQSRLPDGVWLLRLP